MMENLFSKLDDEGKRNLSLRDQLKVDFKDYKIKIMENVENAGKETEGRLGIFQDTVLQNSRQQRRMWFEQQLEVKRLAVKPKHDMYGKIRCTSLPSLHDYKQLEEYFPSPGEEGYSKSKAMKRNMSTERFQASKGSKGTANHG